MRQTRSDAVAALQAFEAQADDIGHLWVLACSEKAEMVQRAAFADLGDMTPSVGDDIIISNWGARKWFLGTIIKVKDGEPTEKRFSCSFPADNSFDDFQLSPAKYGQGLREEQWGKAAKTIVGWMFLRPLKEAGGTKVPSKRTASTIW